MAARIIDCHYPLIHQSNKAPFHFIHGFTQFLSQELRRPIVPTEFKGDIYISDEEKTWCSQVHELTGEDTPFWIINAGGKYDVTVKWWDTQRYQKVVDYFRGKIQFVQVGKLRDYHPKLRGVIDLRGRTDMRQLIRLVYESQGVLCGVTALMHLAAAIETKPGMPKNRPCVVVGGAGGNLHSGRLIRITSTFTRTARSSAATKAVVGNRGQYPLVMTPNTMTQPIFA